MRHVGSEGESGNCRMIGDSVRDLRVADSVGVRLLAYVAPGERDPRHGEWLLEAGADFLVSDMREVTEAFSRADLGCRSAPVGEWCVKNSIDGTRGFGVRHWLQVF